MKEMTRIFKKAIFVVIMILMISLSFGESRSPDRSLVDDISSIPFGINLREMVEYFSAFQTKKTRMHKPQEAVIEKELKKYLKLSQYKGRKENLFDRDFSLIFRHRTVRVCLTEIEEYSPLSDFPYRRWNPRIREAIFRFYEGKLYEIDCELSLDEVSKALVILRVLTNAYGEAKVREGSIHYKNYNRFLWETARLVVEYEFYPSRNRFSQSTGYGARLKLSHKGMSSEVKQYVIRVRGKIRRWLGSL